MSSNLPSENPILPDEINNSYEHPLKDFLILAGSLCALLIATIYLIAWTAFWLAPRIPFEWEPSIAGIAAPKLNEQQKQQQAYLQDLANQLSASQPHPLPVTVHWLPDEDTPNAFAMVAGQLYVTGGLVKTVSSENALAMVIAHEYAHVEKRHPMILFLEQVSTGLLMSAVGIHDQISPLSQSAGLLTLMSFSRDMERAADNQAIELVRAYYGHTAGADEFFAKMQSKEDMPLWASALQTHPATSERLKRLQAEDDTEGKLTPLPSWMKRGADSLETED